MNSKILLIAGCLSLMLYASANAESVLGTTMKNHYRLRSVSCYACHVKGEEKDVLNDFGKVVDELVKDKNISERLAAVEDAEKEAKDKVKDAIEMEFTELLKKFDTIKAPSGKSYSEAIKAGEIENIKTRS